MSDFKVGVFTIHIQNTLNGFGWEIYASDHSFSLNGRQRAGFFETRDKAKKDAKQHMGYIITEMKDELDKNWE